MATSESSGDQTFIIRIDIDGEKYRLELSHSSSAAELRTILTERYDISSDTRFLDSEGYTLFPKDEQTITINHLLTKDNIVKLKKPPPIPILETKTKSSEKMFDLKHAQTISQSTRTSFREVKLPGSTPTHADNKVILATDLDIHMWGNIFRICNLLNGIRMDEETPRRAFSPVFQFRKSDGDFPRFQITDDSYIRVYMKDKEIHSSFLSSRFFDSGMEFSSPLIGIGINTEYSKTKTRTNTQRNTYLTYCFNFPRVTLQLDSSYLEPTSHFIEAIDNVLAILKRDEQIIQLEKVLSTYGHVYPSLIVLGGHLYHKEVHRSKEQAEEAKRRLSGDISFSASIIQSAKTHGGGGSEKQSEEKSSEHTSLLTFEAVGGDTRLNRDPTLWTSTIVDPSLWRIIEQDNYQSVITLLDQKRQQKLQHIFRYDTLKKKLGNLDTTWKQLAVTIVGGNGHGHQLNQLSLPFGITFADDQTLFITDRANDRIMEWSLNAIEGRIVAGGHGRGNQTNQLCAPTEVIVDQENHSLIIADCGNRRVLQWSRQHSTEYGHILLSDITCWGLTMDQKGSLYVSDWRKNEVKRWKRGEKEGTIVAGGNGEGDQLHQLHAPSYLFVDDDESLYVSDQNNHRVMKWKKDAREGIIVAGGNGRGQSLRQLSSPEGVLVDPFGQIYVADGGNHRVMRWCEGAKEGTVVVGGNGHGQQSNQFYNPTDLFFDCQGNLYVVDCWNHRIQKFEIN